MHKQLVQGQAATTQRHQCDLPQAQLQQQDALAAGEGLVELLGKLSRQRSLGLIFGGGKLGFTEPGPCLVQVVAAIGVFS